LSRVIKKFLCIFFCGAFFAIGVSACTTDCPEGTFSKPGGRVMARWEANKWYAASVVKSSGGQWTIKFDDGLEKRCPCNTLSSDKPLKPEDLKKGDPVIARWRGGNWYTAKVAEIEDGRALVTYYDGYQEKLGPRDLRRHPSQ
jgi:hypothetical protein